MRKLQSRQPEKGSQGELENLLTRAQEQFPGISEILQVYGGYEEMALAVKQYLEATQPQPFITTSNRSNPIR